MSLSEYRKRWARSRRGCFFAPDPLSLQAPSAGRSNRTLLDLSHAPVLLLSANPARNAEGSRDRLAPSDAARRHGPLGSGRDLCLAVARLACTQEGRADRA